MLTLVTGGVRSGKSRHALELAGPYRRRLFVATAEAFDDEMRLRIARHRAERAERFETLEEPLDPGAILRQPPPGVDVILLDCLTVWIGNLMHHQGQDVSLDDAPFRTLFDALENLAKPQRTTRRSSLHSGIPPAIVELEGRAPSRPLSASGIVHDALAKPPCDVILVTNEVGMGIVPDNPMARRFRDLAGGINARAAELADQVIFMVSGIPLRLKPPRPDLAAELAHTRRTDAAPEPS